MKKLLLVDGHYYLYRSFYAIRGLTNSRGEPTNAIFGFTKALRRMLYDVQPDFAAVIWDAGLPERRTALQPEYKQQRPEMPADLKFQEAPMQHLVSLLGIASIAVPGSEADDVIASYATAHDGETVIATNDKDILQMVNERIAIYSTAKADVVDERAGFALLGIDEVRKKWGVAPSQIGDVLALTGDSSDNIPGVEGVGSKTATALIQQFGSVDTLLAQAAEIEKLKVREKITANVERIRQNLEMVRLDTDLALPVAMEEMVIRPNYPQLIEAIAGYEFRSLLAELKKEFTPSATQPQPPEAMHQADLWG
jgi:5'-3' exonuclease